MQRKSEEAERVLLRAIEVQVSLSPCVFSGLLFSQSLISLTQTLIRTSAFRESACVCVCLCMSLLSAFIHKKTDGLAPAFPSVLLRAWLVLCIHSAGEKHVDRRAPVRLMVFQWRNCHKYFDRLLQENDWSKAFYTYMMAVSLWEAGEKAKAMEAS